MKRTSQLIIKAGAVSSSSSYILKMIPTLKFLIYFPSNIEKSKTGGREGADCKVRVSKLCSFVRQWANKALQVGVEGGGWWCAGMTWYTLEQCCGITIPFWHLVFPTGELHMVLSHK